MASLLTDYYVTFADGALGVGLEIIHGFPVVARFVCTPSGGEGQASLLGVTLGSVLAEVVAGGANDGSPQSIIQALTTAPRPVRVRFQRSPKLLLPVPPPFPLTLWRGQGAVHLAGTTKEAMSGDLALSLHRDSALGFRVLLQAMTSAPAARPLPAIEVLQDTSAGARGEVHLVGVITHPDNSLVFANTLGRGSDGSLSTSWSVSASALCLPAPHAALARRSAALSARAGASGLVAGGGDLPDRLPVALPRGSPCRACHAFTLRVQGGVAPLLPALLARRFPSEMALQAAGSGGPRCVLEGVLRRWERVMLGNEWRLIKFRLKSDGSLQWFTPQGRQGPEEREGWQAYPWRPRGGICLAGATILTQAGDIASVARLSAAAVEAKHVFVVRSTGALAETLVLSASSSGVKAAWLLSFTRMVQLMQPASAQHAAEKAALVCEVPPPGMTLPEVTAAAESAEAAAGAAAAALTEARRGHRERTGTGAVLGTVGETDGVPRRRGVEGLDGGDLRDGSVEESMELVPAATPAVSNAWLRGERGSAEAFGSGGGIPVSAGPSRRTRGAGLPTSGWAALQWWSVEDLYRARVPGDAGGSASAVVVSPVLQAVAGASGTPIPALVSRSLMTLSPHAATLEFSKGGSGAWSPVLDTAGRACAWRALQQLVGASTAGGLVLRLQQDGWLPGGGGSAPALQLALGPVAEVKGTPTAAPVFDVERVSQVLSEVLPPHLYTALQCAREDPALYFTKPDVAYAVLVAASRSLDEVENVATVGRVSLEGGGGAGGAWDPLGKDAVRQARLNGILRRHHFVTLAGTFLEVLGDAFSAGGVFDAMVEDSVPVTLRVTRTARGGGSSVLEITERVLTYEHFARYVDELEVGAVSERGPWTELRQRLGLDPLEVLVKLEEYTDLALSLGTQPPILDYPPMPPPDELLPRLFGMPGGQGLVQAVTPRVALVEHPKVWGALHAPPHAHASLLPPPAVLKRALAAVAISVASGRAVLRRWMVRHARRDLGLLWPAAIAPQRSRERSGSHQPLVVDEGGVEQRLPVVGLRLKRPPAGRSFPQWARHRRRIARARKFVRRRALQEAAAASGTQAQQVEDLGVVLQRLRGEGDDEEKEEEVWDLAELTPVQLRYLGLIPPPGQGDSGSVTSATTETEDEFGMSSEEDEPQTGPPLPPVDTALLDILDTPTGRRLLATGSVMVRVTGRLMLTDRSMYFETGENEVLAIPLASMGGLEYCRTQSGGDNGLHISMADVRRVCPDEGLDAAGTPSPLKVAFTLAAVMANPTPSQRRTLSAFRWRVAVEQAVDAYFAAPRKPVPPLAQAPRVSRERPQQVDRWATGSSASQGGVLQTTVHAVPLAGGRSVITTASRGGHNGGAGGRAAALADAALTDCVGMVRGMWDLLQTLQYSPVYHGAFGCTTTSTPGVVTPSVTLIFSRLKDFITGRGEERIGGRRRVVREALGELLAAHRLTRRLGVRGDALWGGLAQQGGAAFGSLLAGHPKAMGAFNSWLKQRLASSLEEDNAARLRLVAAAAMNLVRTRALLKSTGRLHSSLLFCSAVQARLAKAGGGGAAELLHPEQEGAKGHVRIAVAAVSLGRGPFPSCGGGKQVTQGSPQAAVPAAAMQTSSAVAQVLTEGYAWQSMPAEALAAQAVAGLVADVHPAWLWRVVEFSTRAPQLRTVRTASKRAFSTTNALAEWRLLQHTVLRPISVARAFWRYTLAWEDPPLTALVMFILLGLAWADWLLYIVPISLFTIAMGVLLWAGLPLATKTWLGHTFTRPRSGPRNLTLMQRWRSLNLALSKTQYRLHRYIDWWQRVGALVTWVDPVRTRLFLLACILAATILCVIPFRALFAMAVLSMFSKPLRDSAPGLYGLSMTRFMAGLPTASLASVVYAPSTPAAQAAVPLGAAVQLISSTAQREVGGW